MAELFIWIIALASIVLMLVRPRGVAEYIWVGCGAVLLVVTRLLPLSSALHAVGEGLDVYLFLAGMMVLAELAREEGVFDWVAEIAVRHARGSSLRLFFLVYGTGVVVTAFLSNDATAVVLTPAVLAAVRRARVPARPHLIACAMVANAASFLLPISNPGNLVVFGSHVPALGPWLRSFLLPSLVSVTVTCACLWLVSRLSLREPVSAATQPCRLSPSGRLAVTGILIAAAALLISSAFGISLGIPTFACGIVALLLVATRDRGAPRVALLSVSWSVLPLVAGLFILVSALNGAGLLGLARQGIAWMAAAPSILAKFAGAFTVALVSNAINNLPAGLAAGSALRQTGHVGLLAHAVLLGVDLGPNLSVTGSLATILWLIALRRADAEISAWQFFRVGLLVMPAALALSLLVLR